MKKLFSNNGQNAQAPFSEEAEKGEYPRVDRLRQILGDPVVFLACKGKKPLRRGWQSVTINQMTPRYAAALERSTINIGVLLGRNSGGLCAIDIDQDNAVEPFIARNPILGKSARVVGTRGCKIFVRVRGEYPRKHKIIIAGEHIGEWLADGSQAIVDGIHPDSNAEYYWTRNGSPAEIDSFTDLKCGEPAHTYSSESTTSPECPESTESLNILNALNDILSLDKRRSEIAASDPFFKTYERFVDSRYVIRPHTRNQQTVAAVTFLHRAIGEPEVIQLMTWLHQLNSDVINDPIEKHLSEVRAHLANCERTFIAELNPIELAVYTRLREHLRAPFRITRDLAHRGDDRSHFFLSCNELAGRLRKDPQQAWRILWQFQRIGILKVAAPGVPGIRSRIATTWRWML